MVLSYFWPQYFGDPSNQTIKVLLYTALAFFCMNIFLTQRISTRVMIARFSIYPMNGEHIKFDTTSARGSFVSLADNQYFILPRYNVKIFPDLKSPLHSECMQYKYVVNGFKRFLFIPIFGNEFDIFIPKEEIFKPEDAHCM
jgi:hypothetical protein